MQYALLAYGSQRTERRPGSGPSPPCWPGPA